MIGIYVNVTRDVGAVNAKKFIELLKSRNIEYCVIGGIDNIERADAGSVCDNMEMLVVFGGDGTVLHAFKLLNGHDVPIIGVNAGNLGFLTEIDTAQIEELADAVALNKYTVEERRTLAVEYGGNVYYAVNDCVLSRGSSARTIRVEMRIDGEYADRVSGDGMLISTPTGSTAYSLSCGGPILNPDVEAYVALPICPHTLHSRPMVVSDKSAVELIADNPDGSIALNIDGAAIAAEDGTVRIKVTMSNRKIKFVRLKEGNFYNKLIHKLNYWNTAGREN